MKNIKYPNAVKLRVVFNNPANTNLSNKKNNKKGHICLIRIFLAANTKYGRIANRGITNFGLPV